MPLVTSSIRTACKHPDLPEAQENFAYASKELHGAVTEIITVLCVAMPPPPSARASSPWSPHLHRCAPLSVTGTDWCLQSGGGPSKLGHLSRLSFPPGVWGLGWGWLVGWLAVCN